MFADTKAYSGFAVPDLAAARKFYGETLGLRTSVPMEGVLLALHLAGDRDTLIYHKPDHEQANYNPQPPEAAPQPERARNGLTVARRRPRHQPARPSASTPAELCAKPDNASSALSNSHVAWEKRCGSYPIGSLASAGTLGTQD